MTVVTESPKPSADPSLGAAGADARRTDWFTIALMAACVGLAVLVVVLARENRHLKAELAAAPPPPRQTVDELRPGASITNLTLVDPAGAREALRFDAPGRRTLLLMYSQGCHVCDLIKPVWKTHVPKESPSVRVLALCADRAADMDAAKAAELPAPAFAVEKFEDTLLPRLRFVPVTVLVDDKGVIERVWWGFEPEKTEQELRDGFAALGADHANGPA